MAGQPEDPVTIEFGRFKVVRHRRELLADGRPVELGGRAFDTLIALIDARGTVLSKDELMSHLWLMSSSLLRTVPRASMRAISVSNARPPSSTGRPSASSKDEL